MRFLNCYISIKYFELDIIICQITKDKKEFLR